MRALPLVGHMETNVLDNVGYVIDRNKTAAMVLYRSAVLCQEVPRSRPDEKRFCVVQVRVDGVAAFACPWSHHRFEYAPKATYLYGTTDC